MASVEAAQATAERFRRFAAVECDVPLYRQLSAHIAADAEVLALAARTRHTPVPLVFLAAVQYLLLKGVQHPLRPFYFEGRAGEAYPAFREFCLAHRAEIAALIETRLVQTNEVRRCALLLPAFLSLTGQPLALIEIGASAGLNLLWDRYGYEYSNGACWGEAAPLRLTCALRGGSFPLVDGQRPAIASRVGIDVNPVEVRNPEAVLWLRALIWPGALERVKRFEHAVAIAQREEFQLIAGDALEALPRVLSAVPEGVLACVYHTFTLNQFSPEARAHVWAQLADFARRRPVVELAVEWLGPEGPLVTQATFERGQRIEIVLAAAHHHGEWLEWKDNGG